MQVFIANNEVMFINTQLRKSPFGEIFLDPNSDILIEIRKQEEEKVNFLEKIFLPKRKNVKSLSLGEAVKILKADPKFLDKFEEMYRKADSSENDSNNLFDINAKQAAEEKEGILSNGCSQDIIDRIVDELLSQTVVWKFDGKRVNGTLDTKSLPETEVKVLKEELLKISKDVRPQFTGTFVAKDMKESSSEIVYLMLQKYMEAKAAGDEQKAASFYGMFRQGLDILDMDSGLYDMIGCNRNSMGYWLPQMIQPVLDRGFFKIPATTIIKVPLTLLQLTRLDYMSFNRATLDIVDAYCRKAFELSEDKDYFIKTRTYSSKFDFRNAHVCGAKEVRELGEYLLFIHWQALQMAAPTTIPHPIYGVSTTNEWVVREFIQDKENNPTIYKGLPLHTEYRIFVDFDIDMVLGIHAYWDAETMKKRFARNSNIHDRHDYVIYSIHEKELYRKYVSNKSLVVKEIEELLPDVNLSGQWSIDVMQNGDEFWIIDMAMASESAFYKETVAPKFRKKAEENWIPGDTSLSD